jgi:arginine metabolism regulation protein II
MFVCDADFSIHLQGTERLRQSRKGWTRVSKATRQLNEISAFLCLLARTTSRKLATKPWTNDCANEADEEFGLKPTMGSCFGYMYGITPKAAACLQETCRLAEYLSLYDSSPDDIPDTLLHACEMLGNRLHSWTFESEVPNAATVTDDITHNMFYHHASAWREAILIFYLRRIQRCTGHEMPAETDTVAEHMHAVEDSKAHLLSNDAMQMAPITWPAFIASCDSITTRDRWEQWWRRVERYGIANIQKQWDVVQQVWQRCDELRLHSCENVSWIDVLQEMQVSILPI